MFRNWLGDPYAAAADWWRRHSISTSIIWDRIREDDEFFRRMTQEIKMNYDRMQDVEKVLREKALQGAREHRYAMNINDPVREQQGENPSFTYGGLDQSMKDLEQSISVIMGRIDQLETITSNLRMPRPPEVRDGSSGERISRAMSPIASRVDSLVQALDMAAWRIQVVNDGLV